VAHWLHLFCVCRKYLFSIHFSFLLRINSLKIKFKKMKKVFLVSFFSFFLLPAMAQLGGIKIPSIGHKNGGTGLSETEIIDGLKEALTKGAQAAGAQLNKTDGYLGNSLIKIPFPEEAKRAESALRDIGMGAKVDEFITSLNRSAEQAAKEAAPIFTGAVKQMNFTDAKNILTGSDTAATAYLRKTTFSQLYSAFAPHVHEALNSNSVEKQWNELATAYNKLPFVKKVSADIVNYTTHKALTGLFVTVAQEEQKIRKDPAAQTSALLKKVFGGK
jgi:hypothetical protein